MRQLMPPLMVVLTFAANGAIAQTSSGTAFAVAPGLLITNHHVVARCSSIEVISADGRRTGSVVDADDQIDLALLRVTGLRGATARLRNPRNIRLGEPVMVFGYPLAGALSSGGNFTSGVVSALRGLRDAAGEIQITAPVQQGNSGGPLLDTSGLVVGVVQAKLDALRAAITTGDIPQNINFAISLEGLADFLTKNRVAFRDGVISAPLDTARVAALAQSFTHRVECRGRPQQTKATPDVKRPPTLTSPEVGQAKAPPEVGQDSLAGFPDFWKQVDTGTTYRSGYTDAGKLVFEQLHPTGYFSKATWEVTVRRGKAQGNMKGEYVCAAPMVTRVCPFQTTFFLTHLSTTRIEGYLLWFEPISCVTCSFAGAPAKAFTWVPANP